jgi:hypothetical protein
MSKDSDARLNATLGQISALFPGDPACQALKNVIQDRLMQTYAAGAARERLSASLSLGGWHPMDTQRRHLERIFLLAEQTIRPAAISAGDVAALKVKADQLNDRQLRRLIRGLADSVVERPLPGVTQLAESFSYTNPANEAKATQAAAKARKLLASAYQGVMAARSVSRERERYERWFGPLLASRHTKVCDNLRAMYLDATHRTLKIYYRGPGAKGKLDDKPGLGYHSPYVQLMDEPLLYGCFTPGWGDPGELDRTHVVLGGRFFSHCEERANPNDVERMSGAGVVIHELSHAVCNTKDIDGRDNVKVLYGPRKCKAAAIERPDSVVNNADNYRLFAEEYDA